MSEDLKNSLKGIKLNNNQSYKYGFVTNIEQEIFSKGLNENIIKNLSEKKNEPEWLAKFRLKSFNKWIQMREPHWANLEYPKIDFQDIRYYAVPKNKGTNDTTKKLSDVDEELLATFEKLGIPLSEQKRISGVAIDAVFDSVSLGTTNQDILEKHGVIFCSMSEAIEKHSDLVKKYIASVVPYTDNFYAALNSAVFSDGSFCYIPPGVVCPIDLSTYFRINAAETGQFERTLLIADKGSFVNYLEGCTAPMRDENQLHAAVVEIVALEGATVNYSTVQNWYAGNEKGQGGIYNFVTKRGICKGNRAKISWTQVEAGSAITWKYPSVILKGNDSSGEFYSVALTNGKMQADTGTKMIHIGENTKSKIISKGISVQESKNSYRGLVKIGHNAKNSSNFTQCDSMLVGNQCYANTFPYIDVHNSSSRVEHEASTSRISEEQIFYFQSRGISVENAISLIVHGFCRDVFKKLPLEFSIEAVKLLEMKLENAVG